MTINNPAELPCVQKLHNHIPSAPPVLYSIFHYLNSTSQWEHVWFPSGVPVTRDLTGLPGHIFTGWKIIWLTGCWLKHSETYIKLSSENWKSRPLDTGPGRLSAWQQACRNDKNTHTHTDVTISDSEGTVVRNQLSHSLTSCRSRKCSCLRYVRLPSLCMKCESSVYFWAIKLWKRR